MIIDAVRELGNVDALMIFEAVQDVERQGGMLTCNKYRRRTPG